MHSWLKQISILYRCSSMFRGDKLKELGSDLGACHYSYIMTICKNPGISQDTIAKKICIDKSNVTRHLSQLEKKGYVKRVQSEEDKRVSLVFPTEKATEALPMIRGIMKEWKQHIAGDFTDEEIEALTVLLHKMAQRAAEYAEREMSGEDGNE